MKLANLLGYLAASALLLAWIPLTAAQTPPPKPTPMPRDQADATFADARVKAFMQMVTSKEIGGTCILPDPAKAMARQVLPKLPPGASPEFGSYFYEIEIPCKGNNGLTSVLIRPEFAPMRKEPLGLTLNYEQ